jgi:hypothetical protein
VEINGYRIFLNDTEVVASGTGAVAPLWGAFLGLRNEQRGRRASIKCRHY